MGTVGIPVVMKLLVIGLSLIWPFAVLSDPVIAGVFSLFNTVLNAATIYFLSKVLTHQADIKPRVEAAVEVLEEQQRNMHKREDDL